MTGYNIKSRRHTEGGKAPGYPLSPAQTLYQPNVNFSGTWKSWFQFQIDHHLFVDLFIEFWKGFYQPEGLLQHPHLTVKLVTTRLSHNKLDKDCVYIELHMAMSFCLPSCMHVFISLDILLLSVEISNSVIQPEFSLIHVWDNPMDLIEPERWDNFFHTM